MKAVSTTVERFAPAKINLCLHVTGQMDDGYHRLESLVVFADNVGDWLRVSPGTTRHRLSASGAYGARLKELPFSQNLIFKALEALESELGSLLPPLHLELEKHLPLGAGIGGGSADAAAALHAANHLLGLDLSTEKICTIALSIGADVPACVISEPVLVSGTGDGLSPLEAFPELSLVLVNPGISVATRHVFGTLEQKNHHPLEAIPLGQNARSVWISWLLRQRNDLTAPARAYAPQIADVLEAINRTNDLCFARMSGSGSTCFGLYPSKHEAETAAKDLKHHHPDWWIKPTTTRAKIMP